MTIPHRLVRLRTPAPVGPAVDEGPQGADSGMTAGPLGPLRTENMADPWIRVHANLGTKPVAHRLAKALGVSVPTATGHLVLFWGCLSQHVPDGDTTGIEDSILEAWAQWKGKRGKFVSALRNVHLDAQGRPREWDDYQGSLLRQREHNTQRQRDLRARRHRDVAVTSRGTIRNDTKRDISTDDDAREANDGQGLGESSHRTAGGGGHSDEAPVDAVPAPALSPAIALTVAANVAIAAKFGEQVRPLLASSGHAHALAAALTTEAIPLSAAIASIARQVEACATIPKSMAYFLPGIRDEWSREPVGRVASVSEHKAPRRTLTYDTYFAATEEHTA